MKLPDDLKHPSGGEHVDELAHSVLKLAHEAIERFPEMKRKHMFLASGAAISSALIVAAGVAVGRRIKAGARPEDAVQEVTEAEIEGLRLVEREPYRPPNARTASAEAASDGPGVAVPAANVPAANVPATNVPATEDTPPADGATAASEVSEGGSSEGEEPTVRDAAAGA